MNPLYILAATAALILAGLIFSSLQKDKSKPRYNSEQKPLPPEPNVLVRDYYQTERSRAENKGCIIWLCVIVSASFILYVLTLGETARIEAHHQKYTDTKKHIEITIPIEKVIPVYVEVHHTTKNSSHFTHHFRLDIVVSGNKMEPSTYVSEKDMFNVREIIATDKDHLYKITIYDGQYTSIKDAKTEQLLIRSMDTNQVQYDK